MCHHRMRAAVIAGTSVVGFRKTVAVVIECQPGMDGTEFMFLQAECSLQGF